VVAAAVVVAVVVADVKAVAAVVAAALAAVATATKYHLRESVKLKRLLRGPFLLWALA
jgi:hypothetical protein